MSRVGEVPFAEGGSILVEVDEPFEGPVVRGRGGAGALPSLAEPLEQVLVGLGPVTRALLSQVRSLADAPHEIEVEFAVKLTADARIVIARAGGVRELPDHVEVGAIARPTVGGRRRGG